jgi:hypothetical protein
MEETTLPHEEWESDRELPPEDSVDRRADEWLSEDSPTDLQNPELADE